LFGSQQNFFEFVTRFIEYVPGFIHILQRLEDILWELGYFGLIAQYLLRGFGRTVPTGNGLGSASWQLPGFMLADTAPDKPKVARP
jgi:hypothetical protein